MKLKLHKLMPLVLGATLLFGCNTTSTNTTTENTSENNSEDTLNIVTSFYPIYISTLNITKDIPNVTVTNMTKAQTGCLHDYQLTPQDLKTLETADILVINGAGMESFLDKIINQYPDLQVIDASEGLDLLEEAHSHDHDQDEHDHDEDDHDHDHDDHDDHELNAHIWVSVTGNIAQVDNISSQLVELDPENSSKYIENADSYTAKLEELSIEMHNELDDLPNRNIITFHEAFPYFAEEFNLNIAGVIQIEPDSEPSAKEVEEIISIIKENNITALFTEPQYSSKIANTIATETGATVYELDPIVTGDSTEDAYDDYINKMKENLNILKEALKW